MERVRISPLARALARKNGVDINVLQGSGPAGRILIKDVQEHKVAPATIAPATPGLASHVGAAPIQAKIPITKLVAKRVKTSGLRRAVAKQMKRSWDNVGYTNLTHEIDVTKMVQARDAIKDPVLVKTGIKLSYFHYTIKAIMIALQEFQVMLTKYDEKTQELIYPGQINMGIAVDTEAGLMVPVIKNITTLSMLDIAKEVARLSNLARTGQIRGKDMTGADFSITSYGSVGSMWGVPVINYPEVAIAGVGAIVDKVYESKQRPGKFYTGKVMHITLAADHRWVDGAIIGRFVSRVKELLESPEILGVY